MVMPGKRSLPGNRSGSVWILVLKQDFLKTTWPPKVGKIIAQTSKKQPKRLLSYILLGFRS